MEAWARDNLTPAVEGPDFTKPLEHPNPAMAAAIALYDKIKGLFASGVHLAPPAWKPLGESHGIHPPPAWKALGEAQGIHIDMTHPLPVIASKGAIYVAPTVVGGSDAEAAPAAVPTWGFHGWRRDGTPCVVAIAERGSDDGLGLVYLFGIPGEQEHRLEVRWQVFVRLWRLAQERHPDRVVDLVAVRQSWVRAVVETVLEVRGAKP